MLEIAIGIMAQTCLCNVYVKVIWRRLCEGRCEGDLRPLRCFNLVEEHEYYVVSCATRDKQIINFNFDRLGNRTAPKIIDLDRLGSCA